KFLQDYNIRSTESDENQTRVYMHANFSGILNIWSSTSEDLFNYLINGDKVREEKNESVASDTLSNDLIKTSFDEDNFDESNPTE
ncbi:MAG: hypothetical protein J6Z11_06335, partial [Candidatus Riflebacteria bacterium]|nr:hypothetical protein [Candidatus Riflebacteria bacterium]